MKRWRDIGKALVGIWMIGVILAAFLVPPPAEQGQAGRIIFFHIPTAWVATLAFLLSAFYSLRYLRGRRSHDDHRAANAAGLGILFCLLATITGAIFARVAWGAFWNWDPRETSIFFLLLFYAAYFGLRLALPDEQTRATLSAAYNLLGLVLVPFLVFVAPRLAVLAGLHPDSIINLRGEGGMEGPYRTVFFASLAGFSGIFFWAFDLANRMARLDESLLENV
ncbi:MAG: cytochrome c biogenesis protein CcsA [Chloroflexia bacterium]|nr:cytochrome c biogenesis protein CcsA [Chloroflexia bacterium]